MKKNAHELGESGFLATIWLFLVKPRYSPLALVIVTLLVLFIYWRYESNVWRSPLPGVQVEVEEKEVVPASFGIDYTFTVDWFSPHVPLWKTVLAPYTGKHNVRYLEVGLFEGMSAIWMLENVLTDETAHLTGIDPFLGDYEQRFMSNLDSSGYSQKVTVIEGYSQTALLDLEPASFDIIYIDGSHATRDVLEDAVLSWRLLKKGGVLIFDDYRWSGEVSPCKFDEASDFPKKAIDAFAICFQEDLEVIHNAYQLIVRKKF
jgi:predicted O-methyltransferase YrrM